MKTLLIVNAIILNLIFSNNLSSQNNSYLDFFGHKYSLKGILYETIRKKYSIIPQNEGTQYLFCGKNILQETYENFSSEHLNIEAWKDSISYKNYLDTVKEPSINYYLSHIHYKLVDCMKFYNVIDSLQIKELINENFFTVFWEGNEQLIYGFKILGNNMDYEAAYNVSKLYSHKVNMKSDNKAKEYLLKIIDENKNCTKFIIKDICIYNKREKINYYLYLEIVLTR